MDAWIVAAIVPVTVAVVVLLYPFSGCLTKPDPATGAPTNLRVEDAGLTSIRLAWDDPNPEPVKFQIWRTPDGGSAEGPFTTIETSYEDTGLAEATTYFYHLTAVRLSDNHESRESDPLAATTLGFVPAFVATLTNNQAQLGGRCLVQRIEPPRLFASGTLVRLTIEASTAGNVVLERVFISRAADSGNPYDAAGDLTEVASGVLLTTGATLVLPPVAYVLDRTQPLLVAFDLGAPGHVRHVANVPGVDARAFIGNQHQAAVAIRQPGFSLESRIYLVVRIEVA